MIIFKITVVNIFNNLLGPPYMPDLAIGVVNVFTVTGDNIIG